MKKSQKKAKLFYFDDCTKCLWARGLNNKKNCLKLPKISTRNEQKKVWRKKCIDGDLTGLYNFCRLRRTCREWDRQNIQVLLKILTVLQNVKHLLSSGKRSSLILKYYLEVNNKLQLWKWTEILQNYDCGKKKCKNLKVLFFDAKAQPYKINNS